MANLQVQLKGLPNLIITAEVRDVEEMFQTLGPMQELFNECKCGKCGGTKIRFHHRKTADGKNDVYELLCDSPVEKSGYTRKCGAKLMIGKQQDSGNLFPKNYESVKVDGKWQQKTDKDGKRVYLPNNGWVHWDKNANDGEGGYV